MSIFKNIFKFAVVITPILFIISTPITTSANTHFIKTNCLLQKSQLHPGKIIFAKNTIDNVKADLNIIKKIEHMKTAKIKLQAVDVVNQYSDLPVVSIDTIIDLKAKLAQKNVVYTDLPQEQQQKVNSLIKAVLLGLKKESITIEVTSDIDSYLYNYTNIEDFIRKFKFLNENQWIVLINNAKKYKEFLLYKKYIIAQLKESNSIRIGSLKGGNNPYYWAAEFYSSLDKLIPAQMAAICLEKYYKQLSVDDKKEILYLVAKNIRYFDNYSKGDSIEWRYIVLRILNLFKDDNDIENPEQILQWIKNAKDDIKKVISKNLSNRFYDANNYSEKLNDYNKSSKNNEIWNAIIEELREAGSWRKANSEYRTYDKLKEFENFTLALSLFDKIRLFCNEYLETPVKIYDILKEIAEDLKMPESIIKIIVRDKENKEAEQQLAYLFQKKIYRAYLTALNADSGEVDWNKIHSLIKGANKYIKEKNNDLNEKTVDLAIKWSMSIIDCLNENPNANVEIYDSISNFIKSLGIDTKLGNIKNKAGNNNNNSDKSYYQRQLNDGTLVQGAGYKMIPVNNNFKKRDSFGNLDDVAYRQVYKQMDDGVESFDHLKGELLTNAGFTENDSGFFVFPLEQGGLEASIGNTYNKIVYTYKDGNKTDRLTIEEHDFGNITLRLSQMIDMEMRNMEIGNNVIMSRGEIRNIKIIEKAKCALISVTDDFFTGDKRITKQERERKIITRTTENGFSYVVVGGNVFSDIIKAVQIVSDTDADNYLMRIASAGTAETTKQEVINGIYMGDIEFEFKDKSIELNKFGIVIEPILINRAELAIIKQEAIKRIKASKIDRYLIIVASSGTAEVSKQEVITAIEKGEIEPKLLGGKSVYLDEYGMVIEPINSQRLKTVEKHKINREEYEKILLQAGFTKLDDLKFEMLLGKNQGKILVLMKENVNNKVAIKWIIDIGRKIEKEKDKHNNFDIKREGYFIVLEEHTNGEIWLNFIQSGYTAKLYNTGERANLHKYKKEYRLIASVGTINNIGYDTEEGRIEFSASEHLLNINMDISNFDDLANKVNTELTNSEIKVKLNEIVPNSPIKEIVVNCL